jgi:DNA/RNA-binding domain of Phe-tRNA-synthetase-like protein
MATQDAGSIEIFQRAECEPVRRLSIEELTERFPFFRVAFVFAAPLTTAPHRSAALAEEIAAAEAECRRRWSGVELSAIAEVAAWRAAYKGFGIKRTSYRSSVERLIKRVVAGQPLPAINALVDLTNMVSLETGLCLGCDDLEKTSGDLVFRFSRPGDSFLDLGAEAGDNPNDPPKEGEVVYADARHVLCRRWNWRQDSRTAASFETRRAVLTVQSNGVGDVEAAAARLARLIGRECGAECRIEVLHRMRPTVDSGTFGLLAQV